MDSCDTEESRGVHVRDTIQQRPESNEEGREHSSIEDKRGTSGQHLVPRVKL